MKSFLIGTACLLIAGSTAVRLYNRWQEERWDHHVVIMADWSELRDAAARSSISDQLMLSGIATANINALLISPSTVQDYLWQKMTFSSQVLAEAVKHQMETRSIVGVVLKKSGKNFVLINTSKPWEQLKDIELGFNPELLGMARQAGLHIVLRVNNDPSLSKENLFVEISEILSANQNVGFLLNTDDVPGGPDALPQWTSLFENQDAFQLLFEFHPAKSAVKAALRSPQTTFRAHTIPSAERKDLTDRQELSRWIRAVNERDCRFLLFHMEPSDSLPSYLADVQAVENFISMHYEIAWPRPRVGWHAPAFLERVIAPLLALLVAIVAPIVALRTSLRQSSNNAYLSIFLLTLAGACVMAALADNPLSRLEVVPFRGVKIAFAMAWLGSFLMLYTQEELREALEQNIRRMDVLFAFVAVVVAGYLALRTGNAGAEWKIGWEQSVRDRLEFIFVARPRFKEFVIGWPLLWVGLHSAKGSLKTFWKDGRFWIGVGMIGPISMVNTFCHLHSPLDLAFLRSANGFILGSLLGWALLNAKKCLS